jgi:colanic acid/amylovoran biosynthesis protein
VGAESENEALRILLVNLHSSHNAGDDALTREAIHQLERQFPHASFTLAMNDPASYGGKGQTVGSFTSWVKPCMMPAASSGWRWNAFPGLVLQSMLAVAGLRLVGHPWHVSRTPERRALLEAYFQADMVISAAGNFLYTSGRVGLPFLLSLFSIYYARLARKPVYTLPQTLGPIRRRHEHLLARFVLSQTRLVLIRDPISTKVWKTWGVRGPQWALLPDLAFARAAEEDRQEALALLREHGLWKDLERPWLGVTLIHWGAQNRAFGQQSRYEDAIEAAIRDFLRSQDGRVVLFSQVQGPTKDEDDRVPARRVVTKLGDLERRVVLIDGWLRARVLKAAYGQMDFFLGTRLHSNIFALTEGVPVIAIGYQYKTRGIMQMMGLEQWTIDIEQVDSDGLVCLLRRAWKEREHTQEHIRRVLPQMREQASRAGALIASDYRGLADGTGGV